MSELDELANEADRSGFWAWFMKWFVRLLRAVSSVKKKEEGNER